MEEDQVRTFLADFDYQVGQIQRAYEIVSGKRELLTRSQATQAEVESAGYWLHNLYSAYEDLFKMIAGFWENHVAANGGYHVSLLKRMCVAIPGVRPQVLSERAFRHLDELRGFRHVFRHAYTYGLDGERVTALLGKALELQESLLGDISQFREAVVVRSRDGEEP
jgi:hypothetical protein